MLSETRFQDERKMSEADLYLGTWELIPELSLYDFGPLPASCTYEVLQHGREIHVRMRWTLEPGGTESMMEFAGPPDGSRRDLDGAPAGVSFSLARIDARTLDSTAFRGDEVYAYARRAVSSDGELLAIVQEGQRPDGGKFRNFQVYRRAVGPDSPD
jgi:hypothetical protein